MGLLATGAREKDQPSVLRTIGAAVALSFGLASSAGAATISQGLTSGVLNTIEDQDREAYVDVDKDGKISVGDVLIGIVRIDNFLPVGLASNNQVYGIISNQIVGFANADPNQVVLGTTTAAGLRLQDITGNALCAGSLFCIYDRGVPFSTDLITNNPAFGATSIKDYIDLITGQGTYRLATGIAGGTDYLSVTTIANFGVGASNVALGIAPVSLTFANFTGGLTIKDSSGLPGFTFIPDVLTFNAFTSSFVFSQLGIANGALRGGVGDGNEAIFGNVGYAGFQQCATAAGGLKTCGLVSDADFFVHPVAVPEPGSLALLGAALMALTGLRRRSTKA